MIKSIISNKIIAERTRILREIRDFTSKELAGKIGMNPRAYSSYETGEYTFDGEMLSKLSQALDIEVSYFFTDEEKARNIIEEQLKDEISISYDNDEEENIKLLISKLDSLNDQKLKDLLLYLVKKLNSSSN
jgi:transcriptional regulator with XRE-family HTH domain